MDARPAISTLADSLFPYSTFFLSGGARLFVAQAQHFLRAVHASGSQRRLPGQAVLALQDLPREVDIGLGTGAAQVVEQYRLAVRRRLRHPHVAGNHGLIHRSEEHTSELQSLMRISYAVFCLKKK